MVSRAATGRRTQSPLRDLPITRARTDSAAEVFGPLVRGRAGRAVEGILVVRRGRGGFSLARRGRFSLVRRPFWRASRPGTGVICRSGLEGSFLGRIGWGAPFVDSAIAAKKRRKKRRAATRANGGLCRRKTRRLTGRHHRSGSANAGLRDAQRRSGLGRNRRLLIDCKTTALGWNYGSNWPS